ncbi:MAG: tRNA pseudouridine(55) synthase TruB [Gammaproteobacteria bacterium]|nr:MAG: tRNA pseudouridine(55) synthase TruB [Gammaproteobacteria bacterium]
MARRRKGRPVNGVLVLDKPLGLSSNQALQKARRLYGAAKAGHTGALDPLASGVLPLCFGEATKFSQYVLDADKTYTSTFVFGQTTASGDADGELLSDVDASDLGEAAVEAALVNFRGAIEQVPSMFSALKQNGQPLYKLAREGKTVARKARAVRVYRYEMTAFRPGRNPEADMLIHCSKGTYIRSLAQDLGEALGCGAYLTALRRIKAGPYELTQALSLSQLEAMQQTGALAEMDAALLPTDSALAHLPKVELAEISAFYLRQGNPVQVPKLAHSGMVRIGLESGDFLGLGEILDDGRLAPRRLIAS